MSSNPINHPSSCRTLLHELQIIWDDTGESGEEKDKILLQIEQECIDVYRRKVEDANKLRDQLRQAIADSKAELSTMCSALGHPTLDLNSSNQNARDGCLKAELENILKQLEEMQRKKADRLNQFHGVLDEINEISVEFGSTKYISSMDVDESDISMIKLEDLHKYLETLNFIVRNQNVIVFNNYYPSASKLTVVPATPNRQLEPKWFMGVSHGNPTHLLSTFICAPSMSSTWL